MNTRSTMHLRLFGSVLGALLASAVGCERIADIDRSKIDETTGTGGATGTGGTTTTTSSAGGGGSAPECAVAEDCADPGNECLKRACTAEGLCVPDKVAEGTPLAKQSTGDCQQMVCDGNGESKSQADNSDLPVDGKECTSDVCTAGVASHENLALDKPCGAGGALYCDGNGACVGCTADAQCGAPTACATPHCVAGACTTDFTAPGTAIAAQTAGDCQEVQCDGLGGTKSVPIGGDVIDDGNTCTDDLCVAGAATHPNAPSGTACSDNGTRCNGAGACVPCLTGADCQSLVCIAQACVAATCTDLVKNGAETDIDCGGPDCGPCADTKLCAAAGDCTSSVCSGSPLSCQAPLCTDTVKNGAESDVDCGGATCPKCAPNKACTANGDCAGGSCVGNTCVPTCTDGVKNGTEADVDCGGSCAAKCATGKACGGPVDCASAVCTTSVCQAPLCTDSIKNGNETDVDCGGADCGDCANGKVCTASGDCLSGVCTGSVCQVPSCSDAIKNGSETDVDCGGSCAPCTGGKLCNGNGDCASNSCTAGHCDGQSCVDGLKNGAETDVDCGGGACPACATGKACAIPADCSTNLCTANVCTAPPSADDEPANNTCAGASAEPLPANISGLSLPNTADVDWFMFTATAADVGKVVHVVTTSTGVPNPCDTVVQVFVGSCGSLVSLGGESDDQDYSENWLSTPIPAAGTFWVKVSYSSFGFSSAPYTLVVSTQ